MSYLQIGWVIGLAIGHTSAFGLGLWLNDRKWRQRRERVAD